MSGIHVNLAYRNMTQEGFDFLHHQNLHPEFYFSGDAIDNMTEEKMKFFQNQVIEKNFTSTIHAPFFDLSLGARDKRIRKVSYERLSWALEAAAKLNATQVVIHPGYGPWVLGHKLEIWLKRSETKLNRLVKRATKLGLKLAFENIYDDSPRDLLTFLEAFPQENVGICFDVGHFNVFSKVPMEKWLNKIGDRIFECHLHDNDGTADQHISIGDGNINYQPLIEWLKSKEKRPKLVLELPHKTHVIKSVNILKNWLC